MNKDILDYLKLQRTCVLAVEMMDGSPHAATVHFATSADPLMFYFETNKVYRKSEPLYGKKEVRATLVVGTTEDNMRTFQTDGIARLLNDDEVDIYNSIYLGKFPEKVEKSKDPNFVRFVFIPTWWRFTDWTSKNGKKITTSEDK
ncbi:MAG TPA: hypothetical protein VF189_06320 [Patescibacteria group bacterium]